MRSCAMHKQRKEMSLLATLTGGEVQTWLKALSQGFGREWLRLRTPASIWKRDFHPQDI